MIHTLGATAKPAWRNRCRVTVGNIIVNRGCQIFNHNQDHRYRYKTNIATTWWKVVMVLVVAGARWFW